MAERSFEGVRLKHIGWVVSILLALGCGVPEPPQSHLSVSDFLRERKDAGFERAFDPVDLRFPRDHGAHPRFRNEWWYLTGNVEDDDGRRFGFQFTLFRNSLSSSAVSSASQWRTNQIYLAHVALTDMQQQRHLSEERFSRAALDLAGVDHEPFRAWLEDWQLVSELGEGCPRCFRVRLAANTEEFSLDLTLSNTKPVVLHGDAGLSQKSQTPGNASYYYSYTRLQTRGHIKVGKTRYAVEGQSWFDHEWSTSSLEDEQVGWDWFSVQLSDQTELMLFQLRHQQDRGKNFLNGTYVDDKGQAIQFSRFTIDSSDSWTSDATGVVYPAAWSISIDDHGLKLLLIPIMAEQEHSASFTYWEGAIDVRGSKRGQPLRGWGYAELTGYN